MTETTVYQQPPDAPKPPTVDELTAQIASLTSLREEQLGLIGDLTASMDSHNKAYQEQRREHEAVARKLDEARASITDLKERLALAETSNQFMRGYLARVQEDDAVREELVAVGDPDAPQLVPKRKPTEFLRPSDYQEASDRRREFGFDRSDRPRKHWITY